ncbi:MAG: hypothetical protein ACREQH_00290, partial [Candidatus Binatus sp.]
MGTTVTAFLVIYVVPQVAAIFDQQHAALPASTRFLIGISGFVNDYWLAFALAVLALIAAIGVGLRTPRGRRLYNYYNRECAESNEWIATVLEPVMTLAMAAVIVFMMLAV